MRGAKAVPWKLQLLAYTHEFLSHILGTNRKTITISTQAMQDAGLISYRRGTIQVLDRAGLETASCECCAVVKAHFDAFLIPPKTALHQNDTRKTNTK
jgi:hypothetical protein